MARPLWSNRYLWSHGGGAGKQVAGTVMQAIGSLSVASPVGILRGEVHVLCHKVPYPMEVEK